jgi:hypothetical protein
VRDCKSLEVGRSHHGPHTQAGGLKLNKSAMHAPAPCTTAQWRLNGTHPSVVMALIIHQRGVLATGEGVHHDELAPYGRCQLRYLVGVGFCQTCRATAAAGNESVKGQTFMGKRGNIACMLRALSRHFNRRQSSGPSAIDTSRLRCVWHAGLPLT